jgi:hypothetical protein
LLPPTIAPKEEETGLLLRLAVDVDAGRRTKALAVNGGDHTTVPAASVVTEVSNLIIIFQRRRTNLCMMSGRTLLLW